MSIRIGSTAPLLALTLATAASAAPAVSRDSAKMAEAGPAHTTVVSASEDDASTACSKSRKRLWVEGEGWIVRKVTTCR